MTKSEALRLLDCSLTELAIFLDISKSAITQWDDEKIPLGREYQIRYIAEERRMMKLTAENTLADSAIEQNI